MKDGEARRRLDSLEKAIADIPKSVADVVIQHFEPRIEQVNTTLDAMRDAASGIDGLGAIVQAMGEAINEYGEMVGVLESEGNTVRVDVTALMETQAQLALELAGLKRILRGFASDVASVVD